MKTTRIFSVILTGMMLSSVINANANMPIITSSDKKLKAHIVDFADLSGWDLDQQEKALVTFKRSCRVMAKSSQSKLRQGFTGRYSDWSGICAAAKKVASGNRQAARSFFERNFVPARLINGNDRGLFTGYYEPELAASLKRSKAYSVPLYRVPKDLRRSGKAYFTRAQIENGALKNRGLEFVYLKNSIDAFFLHVQGSGRLFLDNGKMLRVGFAAKNGRPYTSIGKVLINQGALVRQNVSMQSIRHWLTKNPQQAARVMQKNQSFIFFRPLKNTNPRLGPIGAQGVPLAPKRSLAIDRSIHGYGLPFWLETEVPDVKTGKLISFRQLMIAQDTGSAIKGPIRGDIYWGSGKDAGAAAGKMQQSGKLFLLLPKRLAAKFQR